MFGFARTRFHSGTCKAKKATEAFRLAVKLDPTQGEAWMNIASSPEPNISDSDIVPSGFN